MKALELYLHIPFCVRKCQYCDFLSGSADGQLRERYVQSLIREINAYRTWAAKCQVETVFLGGGTPSLLSGDQIERIFEALEDSFIMSPQAEITMECNPGTVDKEKLGIYRRAGVNRLSLGLQSADDRELEILGRIHTWEKFQETYEAAREAGFNNINVDLMSAIPGQTLESWSHTLEKVCSLPRPPEHISAYSLIIEEGTPFYEQYGKQEESSKKDGGYQVPPLPDEDTERKMYYETGRCLESYGYERYEISNYARPGRACRHNLGYWEGTWYLGMGLGSSSLIGHTRFSHLRNLERYLTRMEQMTKEYQCIKPWEFPVVEEQQSLTCQAQMEEFMFLGLRKIRGIEGQDFQNRFGCNIREIYGTVLDELEAQKFLAHRKDTYALTTRGIDVSNRILSQFLLD